jgi:hypothetical protein
VVEGSSTPETPNVEVGCTGLFVVAGTSVVAGTVGTAEKTISVCGAAVAVAADDTETAPCSMFEALNVSMVVVVVVIVAGSGAVVVTLFVAVVVAGSIAGPEVEVGVDGSTVVVVSMTVVDGTREVVDGAVVVFGV